MSDRCPHVKGDTTMYCEQAELFARERDQAAAACDAIWRVLANRDVEVERLRASLSKCLLSDPPGDCYAAECVDLRAERDEARDYLSRLLAHHAPGCEPLDDLLGVCTQIDNLLCGMMTVQEHDEVRAERDAIQKAFDASADEFAEMRRESWLMGVRLREARDERDDARRLVEMMRDDPGAIVPVPLPWEGE